MRYDPGMGLDSMLTAELMQDTNGTVFALSPFPLVFFDPTGVTDHAPGKDALLRFNQAAQQAREEFDAALQPAGPSFPLI